MNKVISKNSGRTKVMNAKTVLEGKLLPGSEGLCSSQGSRSLHESVAPLVLSLLVHSIRNLLHGKNLFSSPVFYDCVFKY